MRTRLLIHAIGFGLLAHAASACGAPALDDLEREPVPEGAGGATAVAIGGQTRGGSAGRKSSSRGGESSNGGSGAEPAAGGGTANSPPPDEPATMNTGGASTNKGGAPALASGGRVTAGGAPSASGGSSHTGAAAGSSDTATGGTDAATGGSGDEPQGGAPAQPSGGQSGSSPEPLGGSSSQGGEASGGAPVVTEPPERTLWFSEYVEGSGNLKALEIAALSEQSTSGCRIEVFSNGELDSPSVWMLQSAVSPAAPLVVCTEELDAALRDAASNTGSEPPACVQSRLNFNGDDAVLLRCDGRVIDVIGQVGSRPEKQWGEGELRTLNMTLRRSCSVSSGDTLETDAFDPALEWQASATDDLSDLGTHCIPSP
jgi:hypothetical protein